MTTAYAHCPDDTCLLPAEVVDEYVCESTAGPVLHVVTLCPRGHRYTTPDAYPVP